MFFDLMEPYILRVFSILHFDGSILRIIVFAMFYVPLDCIFYKKIQEKSKYIIMYIYNKSCIVQNNHNMFINQLNLVTVRLIIIIIFNNY